MRHLRGIKSTRGAAGLSDRRHVIDTLARMLDGCRANLIHFTGGTQAANMAEQWQYRGFPPMTRVIEVRHCRPAPRPGFSTGW